MSVFGFPFLKGKEQSMTPSVWWAWILRKKKEEKFAAISNASSFCKMNKLGQQILKFIAETVNHVLYLLCFAHKIFNWCFIEVVFGYLCNKLNKVHL